jgi:hypothetical protein
VKREKERELARLPQWGPIVIIKKNEYHSNDHETGPMGREKGRLISHFFFLALHLHQ